MSEWQPIETAPKDGTDVLIADRHQVLAVAGFWNGEWRDEPDARDFYLPTHWMPLPDPPPSDPPQP